VTLNPDLVRTRCQEIEDAVARLERLRSLTRADFVNSEDARDIACYRLLVAAEAALALCYHVSARRLSKVPEDYAGCFTLLRDAGLIDPELADRLGRMARFRNLLVHMYWKIDYDRVYDVIAHDLDDLRAFSRRMAALI
jgi:uncharacterized protein YutE (UPF0331/DUF86 family)